MADPFTRGRPAGAGEGDDDDDPEDGTVTVQDRRAAARKLTAAFALAVLGLVAATFQELCGPLGLVLGGAALLKRGAT